MQVSRTVVRVGRATVQAGRTAVQGSRTAVQASWTAGELQCRSAKRVLKTERPPLPGGRRTTKSGDQQLGGGLVMWPKQPLPMYCLQNELRYWVSWRTSVYVPLQCSVRW